MNYGFVFYVLNGVMPKNFSSISYILMGLWMYKMLLLFLPCDIRLWMVRTVTTYSLTNVIRVMKFPLGFLMHNLLNLMILPTSLIAPMNDVKNATWLPDLWLPVAKPCSYALLEVSYIITEPNFMAISRKLYSYCFAPILAPIVPTLCPYSLPLLFASPLMHFYDVCLFWFQWMTRSLLQPSNNSLLSPSIYFFRNCDFFLFIMVCRNESFTEMLAKKRLQIVNAPKKRQKLRHACMFILTA